MDVLVVVIFEPSVKPYSFTQLLDSTAKATLFPTKKISFEGYRQNMLKTWQIHAVSQTRAQSVPMTSTSKNWHQKGGKFSGDWRMQQDSQSFLLFDRLIAARLDLASTPRAGADVSAFSVSNLVAIPATRGG
ncbi:hypothetical protein [Shimia ponticola]|uniref:hypothetical protein n=1 Tax=Shimia ponticola TaxID=2582893 RepID=UPI0011BEE9AF|nr:hypothetical protein [Shimia ponticola]